LVPRADLATVLNLGVDGIEPDAVPAIGPAVGAAGELLARAPWSWLVNRDALDFEIQAPGQPTRQLEGCVLGAGGEEFGLALYDQPGSLERVTKAIELKRPADARAVDAYGFTIDRGPSWVTEAVAAAYGTPLAIVPLRLRGGLVRIVSADDLAVMASAAAAAAHLTSEHREHTVTLTIADVAVTATARVRASRPAA
ncbi:MAG: hypothetical protein M3680_04425, partial [Myxococcota bacterium]|nr:hypothetical protein [Myxococcota bacterium]